MFVLCLHSCTIVTSSRVHSNVLSEEGGVDLRLVIPIQLRVTLFNGLNATTSMILVEWKLTTFLRQEPWLDAPLRTRGVARLRAARGATGDHTRAWWRVQPRPLTQKRGQFLQQCFNLLALLIAQRLDVALVLVLEALKQLVVRYIAMHSRDISTVWV